MLTIKHSFLVATFHTAFLFLNRIGSPVHLLFGYTKYMYKDCPGLTYVLQEWYYCASVPTENFFQEKSIPYLKICQVNIYTVYTDLL